MPWSCNTRLSLCMFEQLASDETGPWACIDLAHPGFNKVDRRYDAWFFGQLYTHLWFVQVLGEEDHEEHTDVWGWDLEENRWPDSEMLALRGHHPLVITPISWERYHANERGDFYLWISDIHQMSIALAMSTHTRLGQRSSLGMIPADILFEISFAVYRM